MREIRHFEMEYGEPAVCWRAARPLSLKVTAGTLWLTIEGEPWDHWLAAGESFELPPGARAWGSASADGAQLALAMTRAHGTHGTARGKNFTKLRLTG